MCHEKGRLAVLVKNYCLDKEMGIFTQSSGLPWSSENFFRLFQDRLVGE
jgi:hypothetical protein